MNMLVGIFIGITISIIVITAYAYFLEKELKSLDNEVKEAMSTSMILNNWED